MTNQEIYTATLRLLGEPSDEDRTEDYAERAPYILANFISDNAAVDKQYRQFTGAEEVTVKHSIYVPLTETFPLSDRFAPAAQFYLAYLLVSEEDPERSDTFFDRFCTAISTILAELPATREKILNVYN